MLKKTTAGLGVTALAAAVGWYALGGGAPLIGGTPGNGDPTGGMRKVGLAVSGDGGTRPDVAITYTPGQQRKEIKEVPWQATISVPPGTTVTLIAAVASGDDTGFDGRLACGIVPPLPARMRIVYGSPCTVSLVVG